MWPSADNVCRQGFGTMRDAITAAPDPTTRPGLREALAFERQMIGRAIQAHQGRMDDAADALGIGPSTKSVKLGLDKDALL